MSGLEDNKIVLEIGRYCVDADSDIKYYVDGTEVKHLIKAITPTRITVGTPSEETTLVIWKI